MDFGALVKQRREALGMSKVDLGGRIGTDHSRIWRIEEKGKCPTAKQAAALIRVLDLDEAEALAALEGRALPESDEDDASTADEKPVAAE